MSVVIISLFNLGRSDECIEVSHMALICIYLMMLSTFHLLTGYLDALFYKVSV